MLGTLRSSCASRFSFLPLLCVILAVPSCRKPTNDPAVARSEAAISGDAIVPAVIPTEASDKEAGRTPGGPVEVETDSERKVVEFVNPVGPEEAKLQAPDIPLPEKPSHQAEDSLKVPDDEADGLSLRVGTRTGPATIVLDKQGRDGNRYVLYNDNQLWVFLTRQANLSCIISTSVLDFKISTHKQDAALLYYIMRGRGERNLWVMRPFAAGTGSTCPTFSVGQLMTNVKVVASEYRYTVVSNTSQSENNPNSMVNMALSTLDRGVTDILRGWGNVNQVFSQTGVNTYSMNSCWGTANRTFNTVVAFSITNSNRVWAIEGLNPSSSREQAGTWASIEDFRRANNVCGVIGSPTPSPSRQVSASPSPAASRTPSVSPSRLASATPSPTRAVTPSASPSRSPAGTPSPTPSRAPSNTVTVQFNSSDSCGGTVHGTATFTGNRSADDATCTTVVGSSTASIWGVRINGTCYNVRDTVFAEACRRFRFDPANPLTVQTSSSDSCSATDATTAFLRYPSDAAGVDALCSSVAQGSSQNTWGMRTVDRGCIDVQDTSLAAGCQRGRYMAQTPGPGEVMIDFFRSDSCAGNYQTRIKFGTDRNANLAECSRMAPHVTDSVWGIRRLGGNCENITDGSFASICNSLVPAAPSTTPTPTNTVRNWRTLPTQTQQDQLIAPGINLPSNPYTDYRDVAPAANLDLPGLDILQAMEESANHFQTRVGQANHGMATSCLVTGFAPTHWSDMMIHYYCIMNEPRRCYTFATSGGVPRFDAYKGCIGQWTGSQPFPQQAEVPNFQWVTDRPLHRAVFQYVMFGQTYAFKPEQEQAVINAFWRVTNPNDTAECNAKRPRRTEDPTDGTHCRVGKVMNPRLVGRAR